MTTCVRAQSRVPISGTASTPSHSRTTGVESSSISCCWRMITSSRLFWNTSIVYRPSLSINTEIAHSSSIAAKARFRGLLLDQRDSRLLERKNEHGGFRRRKSLNGARTRDLSQEIPGGGEGRRLDVGRPSACQNVSQQTQEVAALRLQLPLPDPPGAVSAQVLQFVQPACEELGFVVVESVGGVVRRRRLRALRSPCGCWRFRLNSYAFLSLSWRAVSSLVALTRLRLNLPTFAATITGAWPPEPSRLSFASCIPARQLRLVDEYVHEGPEGPPYRPLGDRVGERRRGGAATGAPPRRASRLRSTHQTRIATAVSELARNALSFAGGGEAEFLVELDTNPQMFLARIADCGPGIANLDDILSGAHRSSTGMGLGLVGARRLMDKFEIATKVGKGTTATVGLHLPSAVRASIAAAWPQSQKF